jgi:hypothetical protein
VLHKTKIEILTFYASIKVSISKKYKGERKMEQNRATQIMEQGYA